MKKITWIFAAIVTAGMLLSCSKGDEPTPDDPGTETPDTPDDPSTPNPNDPVDPFPTGRDRADFASFNNGEPQLVYDTYTNASGWTAENCVLLAGDAEQNESPYFNFIHAGALAPTLNGQEGSAGKLTSPLLVGGIGKLSFNYGLPFGDNQFKLTISLLQNGKVVKEEVLEKTNLEKQVAYNYVVDFNVTGSFQLVIENNCLSGSKKYKDRVAIWNLDWTEKN